MGKWNLLSEYNVTSIAPQTLGEDRPPASLSVFEMANGALRLRVNVNYSSPSGVKPITRYFDVLKGLVLDPSKTYKIDIYSYYSPGVAAANDTDHVDRYRGSSVTAEFATVADLVGLNVPTDITGFSYFSMYIKFHVVIYERDNNRPYAKINGTIKPIVRAYTRIDGVLKKIAKGVSIYSSPFEIDELLDLGFTMPAKDFTYEKYDQVMSRYAGAEIEVFGRDASNTYDLKCVHIGTKGKPCLMITNCMHGTEWQTTQYTTGFALDLLNDTFPDKALRDKVVNNFHLIIIPTLNPWGMDRVGVATQTGSRRNFNYIDLNRDFAEGNQSQAETKAFVSLFLKYRPFACMDAHMFGPGYDAAGGNYLIIGNGHSAQNDLELTIRNTVEDITGYVVQDWTPVNAPTNGLLRAFAARTPNPYGFKTISYITELERAPYPEYRQTTNELSNSQIYQGGYAFNYLFLLTSIMYFEHFTRGISQNEVYFET